MNKNFYCLLLLAVLFPLKSAAQGQLEDYRRAAEIRGIYSSKVINANVRPMWIEGTDAFWYREETQDGSSYIMVNTKNLSKKAAFNHQKLAKALSKVSGKTVEATRLPMRWINFKDLNTIEFDYEGQFYQFANGKLTKTEGEARSPWGRRGWGGDGEYWGTPRDDTKTDPIASPDGTKEAFLRNSNLYVRDLSNRSEKQLSWDGAPGEYYSSDIVWSPDSKNIAVMKISPVKPHYIHFVESSPRDQKEPILHERHYFKPGDALPFQYPHIFNVESGAMIKPDKTLFDNTYENSYLRWVGNDLLTFEYNGRGHQHYRVLGVDAQSGKIRPIVDEYQKTFVNYVRIYRYFLENNTELIWSSERDNYNHLYLYDIATGEVKNQITRGEWYVREVLSVDEEKRQILFTANGERKDEDPYLIHYYRVNFDGTGLTCLTPEMGNHSASFSPDGRFIIDTYSTMGAENPPVTVLRDASDGKILMELARTDLSRLIASGWVAPEVFAAKGRDGVTDMWGLIVRPSNFDPNKKYPVVEYIYAGPGDHYVPKSFSAAPGGMQDMAELGFIVVQVDCMGTSYRSKAFEDVICKNVKDSGFEDRILWMKAAAEKYPQMDIEHVGIYGASAGGQEAMWAVLWHPEFYKAAYAGCGCHDNRMDKIWWNEQWMGYPIGQHYSDCSNVDNAWRLTRPLMLMVGEMDDNVDPASTYQVVDALQRAGKEFDLIVVPGSNHSMGGSFGDRKRYDFFIRHLYEGTIKTPDWNQVELKPSRRF